jgi:3-oxoacyl-[acyl-carrier-protein] synthase III
MKMYNTINTVDNAETRQRNEALYLKYSMQEMDGEVLIQKYHHASKNMKKIIRAVFEERGFNRNEIELLFTSLK